ncbi:MAG TPA: tripartite tricarboxylate transporter substrate binding protein [Burkholderiales bacterium]|jgi:tripartite-type tricarboxylate transporter receptor subunit TctC|nr:tripartite tricarboxylate transporter substrate binding protein [Burkholderiales bacterium]
MKTCLIAIALCCAMAAAAQPYPSRPVRVIVPVSAGGLQDTMARAISLELAKAWGQNVLVESRPGANGIIATEYVARAAPDGYTVLMNDSAPLTINPFLYRKLPYDAVKDFAPVIGIAQVAFIMVAYPQFPPNTLREVFALARARPGEINYASYGLGSSNHLETEALGNQAGVRFTHVPYKGGADLMPALLAGQVQFALVGVAPVLAQIRQGRLKPIVYGATQRSVLLPEVPTISESGLPGYDARAWLGWFLPAATPRPIADKIAADVARIIGAPEFLGKYITSVGLEPLNLPPEPFAEFVRAERAKNEARLKHITLRLD